DDLRDRAAWFSHLADRRRNHPTTKTDGGPWIILEFSEIIPASGVLCGHEASGVDELPRRIDGRQTMLRGKLDNLRSVRVRDGVIAHGERIDSLRSCRLKRPHHVFGFSHVEKQGYQTGNPYGKLIDGLMKQGIQIELCGATAAANHWANKDLLPGVKVNTNAMVRVTQLEQQGFTLIY